MAVSGGCASEQLNVHHKNVLSSKEFNTLLSAMFAKVKYLEGSVNHTYLMIVQLFFFQYNNHEIRSGKHIGVCISVANNRLFVGSIPKSKTKEQIVEEFSKVTGKSVTVFCRAGKMSDMISDEFSSSFGLWLNDDEAK